MNRKAAITIMDTGCDYKREIGLLKELDIEAVYIPLGNTHDEKTIISHLSGFDFVLAGSEIWNASVFEGLKENLKMVSRLGTGVDNVDIPAATAQGIAVSNAPGANACSVAQHVLALMLDLARLVTRYDASIRQNAPMSRRLADDLIGKTIGLLGFGNISKEVVRLLSGFDCNMLAFDIQPDKETAVNLGVRFVPFDEMVSSSDFISLHVPLTEQTRGMVDWNFMCKMKPTAYLINTSRGPIVNECDLVRALEEGIIMGAGLDVFESQPLSTDSRLIRLSNSVLTPYVAFSSRLGNKRTFDMVIQSISDYKNGHQIRHLLNPDYEKALI